MGKIMDDAMAAYEARIQAQVEMVKLRELGDKYQFNLVILFGEGRGFGRLRPNPSL